MPQINKPSSYFNTKLYTGNGSTQSISGIGFQPDFCWLKSRTQGSTGYNGNHLFFDNVRGVENYLRSDLTNAEGTLSTSLTSFDSDGFTLGTLDNINNNGDSFVSWSWLAGGTASSNTDGSITSSVSASTTSGFSIVSYTGTGANATVGHGLGTAPSMMIFKNRDRGDYGWRVYHKSLGATKNLNLQTTGASETSSSRFNNTEPTSSVFSIGTDLALNTSSQNIIAYCFAEKKGFSKAFSYIGNGSADGNFTYLGFRPAWIMVKRTDNARDWVIFDNKRNSFNVMDKLLYPNTSGSEGVANTFDFLSNGFKNRSIAANVNASGGSYIGIAFAENPLVSSAGVPCTAR